VAKFEVAVNVAADNRELGDHLAIIVVVEADDVESAVTTAAKHVGKLEGGKVYGVEAEYPEGCSPAA
jgi:DNA-binding GntR family transcriptional regulator